jgi:hypothetical protein
MNTDNLTEISIGENLNDVLVVDLFGGADGSRTHDLLNAIQALSQLSYGPTQGSN